jgi:cysteine desulfurase
MVPKPSALFSYILFLRKMYDSGFFICYTVPMFSFFKKSSVKKIKDVYLDHASATPIDADIMNAYISAQKMYFANPGSIHKCGVEAAQAIALARGNVARTLKVRTEEIIFTASGTEANNLALFGVIEYARANALFIPHVITTNIEHTSVLEPLRMLAKRGDIDLNVLPVNKNGVITVKDIREHLRKETILVSVIHANNEVGTVQPVREIGKMLEKYREEKKSEYPYLHTDSCQAINYLDVRPEAFRIDICSLNSSKIYAPRGVGILYVGHRVKISPIITGGGQERGLRAGTENTAAIIACTQALEKTVVMREIESARLKVLQDSFFEHMQGALPQVRVWGSMVLDERLPNNINISIPGIFSEELVIGLDAVGIAISSKSACGMGNDEGSYFVRALGGTEQESKEAIRISMGRTTTKEIIDVLISEIVKIVERNTKAKTYTEIVV